MMTRDGRTNSVGLVVALTAVGVALCLGATGCSGYDGSSDPNALTEAPHWRCFYDVTYNRNWHDDVLCSNGVKQIRPTLRPKDKFVTESEIMRAAAKYEKKLNAGK